MWSLGLSYPTEHGVCDGAATQRWKDHADEDAPPEKGPGWDQDAHS